MDFAIEGLKITAEVKESSFIDSRHTGNKLEKMEIEIITDEETIHEILIDFENQGRKRGNTIISLDDKGNSSKSWKLISSSYSYSYPHEEVKYHKLSLEEVEELDITELKINGLIVHPYEYSEEFDNDSLSIEARLKLTGEFERELNDLLYNKRMEYFPVIRYGINEVPLEMRFGKIYWSKHKDGNKYALILVDKLWDEQKRIKYPSDDEKRNCQKMVILNVEVINMLLEMLARKKLLDQKEIDEINKIATDNLWRRSRDLYLVDNIDEFKIQ
jgi:hypothetical protein